MQDYNTIVGVIQMRSNECSFSVIRARYHIGITGSGEYAYQINVYRTAKGLVHGCPT